MKIVSTLAALALGAMAGVALAMPAQAEGLVVIITPSHDNPFFAAEAAGAKAIIYTVDSAADGNRHRAARYGVGSA